MKRSSVLATAALMALTAVSQAHTHLKQALPADGSVVTTAPAEVVLSFSEAARITSLSLQKHGEAEQKLAPLPIASSPSLTVPLPKLVPGTYAVMYRVVSDDGHIMGGKITFTFDPQGTPSAGKAPAHDHGDKH